MKTNTKTPWLDDNGNPLTDKELREVSKGWTPSVWESYLKTIEVSQKEIVKDDRDIYSSLSDEFYKEHYLDMMTHVELPNLKNLLHRTLELLPADQQAILQKMFWEDQSLREIAADLDLGKSVIHKKMNFAFENLGSVILGLASGSPEIRRPNRRNIKGA